MKISILKRRAEEALFFLKFNSLFLKIGDKTVIDNETFDIGYSNIILFKGRVGSGKSSVLMMLSDIMSASAGDFLHKSKTGEDLQPVYIHSMSEFNFVTGLIDDELKFANLSIDNFKEFQGRMVSELSGGELKKLAIRMAMNYDFCNCIAIDEPLDMLDDDESKVVADIIINASKAKPILIATHDDNFDNVADIIIEL